MRQATAYLVRFADDAHRPVSCAGCPVFGRHGLQEHGDHRAGRWRVGDEFKDQFIGSALGEFPQSRVRMAACPHMSRRSDAVAAVGIRGDGDGGDFVGGHGPACRRGTGAGYAT